MKPITPIECESFLSSKHIKMINKEIRSKYDNGKATIIWYELFDDLGIDNTGTTISEEIVRVYSQFGWDVIEEYYIIQNPGVIDTFISALIFKKKI